METVTILRELWRRRLLVGVVSLAALATGLLLTYTVSFPPETRQQEVGIASTRILVDTPDSQVVDVAPKGSDTLGLRANLLANLMSTGEVKGKIARRAGLRPGQLLAVAQSADEVPEVFTSAERGSRAHLLLTRPVTNSQGEPLPIVEVEAQAPDAASAARLASAAVGGLGAYLDSKAANEDVDQARRLEVAGLGAPQVREEVRGSPGLVALAAAALVALVGCAAIVIVPVMGRRWHAAPEHDAPPKPNTQGAPDEPPPIQNGHTAADEAPDRGRILVPAAAGGWRAASEDDPSPLPNPQAAADDPRRARRRDAAAPANGNGSRAKLAKLWRGADSSRHENDPEPGSDKPAPAARS